MSIPFWEETYKNDDILTFGPNPNASLVEVEKFLELSDNIIDVGCGDGHNVLYLAKQGYKNIDAFDLSENAIAKLHRISVKDNLSAIHAWVDDLCKFSFKKQYKLIMTFGTLHFVLKEDWHNFIYKAKEATVVGGINIIQLFTDTVPASSDIAPYAVGLAKDHEIKELYSDWDIISYNSYVFEDEHPNVPKHLHASNKIVARKVK
ncbi:MAG: methyltransferase domain-containing protein [Lachnospiraceae bacterium]|nr:methyltransferase domain-containing protein [Lachnospiraceae bacterium]